MIIAAKNFNILAISLSILIILMNPNNLIAELMQIK